jgi:hypothetical protein
MDCLSSRNLSYDAHKHVAKDNEKQRIRTESSAWKDGNESVDVQPDASGCCAHCRLIER